MTLTCGITKAKKIKIELCTATCAKVCQQVVDDLFDLNDFSIEVKVFPGKWMIEVENN